MNTSRFTFYLFIVAMTLLDAVLIRSPNLLGKIGLWIYKYHYLRTFPKALLTVSMVVGVSIALAELIRFGVRRGTFKRAVGSMILISLLVLTFILLVKTGMDFTSGAYSQTGIRFRIGACLLPAIMISVFGSAWATLPVDPESTNLTDHDH